MTLALKKLYLMYGLLLGVAILAGACAKRKKPAQAATPPPAATPAPVVEDTYRPGWVRKRPIDNDYYIGIGMTEIKPGERDYKERAKKDALNELCSQIEVNLKSNSYLVTINRDYKFQQDYLSASKATVNTNIEGYRIIDEYDNGREYWIYFSLSREEYRQRQLQKLQQASSTALAFYSQAEGFKKSYHYSSAILFYGKALASLRNYLNEAPEADYQGKRILLINECFQALQSLLNNTQLQFSEKSLNVKFGKPLNKSILLQASAKDNPKARLNDLPLRFRFSSGKGKINSTVNTNNEGKAFLQLSKVSSKLPAQEIEASIDLEAICAADSNWSLIRFFMDKVSKPAGTLALQVSGMSFYFNSVEKNLDKPLDNALLSPMLGKKLLDMGLTQSNTREEADWVLNISANTKQNAEAYYDLIICLLNFQLSINDKSNSTIYRYQGTDIKGIQLKAPEAGLDAYKKAYEVLSKSVFPELDKLLFE